MVKIFSKIYTWYQKNEKSHLYLVAFLFSWQLVHLAWLTLNVVFFRIFGQIFWQTGPLWDIIISLVDYTEIPALVLGSIFYLSELKKEFKWKNVFFLIFLNSQWLHLFWITDEVVVAQFTGEALVLLPIWLSWFAILIDYLELPVIYDTVKKSILSLRKNI